MGVVLMATRMGTYGPRDDRPVARQHPEAGEYSWGPGLTPKGLENALPADGGRYRGKTSPVADDPGLRALTDRLNERG
ncbi:hypothetical protein C6369_005255 [Rhodococcus rhodochrous]|uniref:hypothetical protein n=1 Tax=Rhodococcus rhodochrous TaxID=1829 RepID=UPI000D0630DD|nr:hypothetical protein [Rhodococcus rhodochrous]AYA23959.1 hypothetical protein C6369_005255 [Rhodococcus rhodochrous]